MGELAEQTWDSAGGHPLAQYKSGYSKTNQLKKQLVGTEQLQPGDVEDVRQFWLTVYIPATTPAGTYRAQVTISANNAPTKTLALHVTVPDFDLEPPQFEYIIYYAGRLIDEVGNDAVAGWTSASERQYLAECRNMVAHGCKNPCVWDGPGLDKEGKPNFTKLSRYLDLREKAGMEPGGPLYMFDGGGMIIKSGDLTDEENQRNVAVVRRTVAWARARGYRDVYFMGIDEASGDRLRAGRGSCESIREGGAKIWAAVEADCLDIAGDLLDRVIITHPGHFIVDATSSGRLTAGTIYFIASGS